MTISAQTQAPAGAPNSTGGQFQSKGNSNPEIGYEAMNGQGSFLFPNINPDTMTVDEYIDFWENVAAPSDRLLSNVMTAFARNRSRWLATSMESWSDRYQNDPLVVDWVKRESVTRQEAEDAFNTEREREYSRLSSLRPTARISSLSVRAIAVAGQIYNASGGFTAERQAEIDGHTVVVSRSRGPQTVKEIHEEYFLSEWFSDALTDSDLGVDLGMQSVAEELRLAREQGFAGS